MHSNKSTLSDSVVILLLSGICFSLLSSSLVRERAQARSIACGQHLATIGLAAHNYHAAYNRFPPALGGSEGGEDWQSNQGRLGPLVGMLPFMEQQELWEQISNTYEGTLSKKQFVRMGPAPWYDSKDYLPWSSAPANLVCPEVGANSGATEISGKTATSWDGLSATSGASGILTTNYVACFGDGTQLQGKKSKPNSTADLLVARASQRGAFSSYATTGLRDILDGTSNTLLYSEAISFSKNGGSLSKIAMNVDGLSLNPSLCLKIDQNTHRNWFDVGRGARWADGALAITGFQTVLPPNSPSCLSERGLEEPVVSASSYHAGGVPVLFADGHVAFASNEIDCGSSSSAGIGQGEGYGQPGGQSPFGIWGKLGSRAGKESFKHEPSLKPFTDTPTTKAEPMETWTDKTGKKKINARFVRIINKSTVELESWNGDHYLLPLNSLSDADILRAVKFSLRN